MEKISSNRSFGILFSIVFAAIAFWPLLNLGEIRVWSVIVSSIFLLLGLINSKLLHPLNLIWVKFGELIGKIVAPLVMALIFFIILTPIGIFLRLIGKDLLNIKLNNNKTYWIKRDKKPGSMKRQF
jgi:ABC-type uncharacterized transport system permease subunit|tara:strand:- start:104 stop:481 length:378 start_codon:yes stop_codon:yes gene_type:complete